MPANIANADRFVHYTPNNSTGPFPVPFPVFDPTGADLEVTLNGQVVTSGWSFTGTLEPGFYGAPNTWVNGSISFDAPISGSLYIEGNRAPRRPAEAQFAEGRGIPARDHNTEFNTLTAICRELFQRLRRTIRVPLGEQGLELPPIADRIGKYVGWDGNGNFIPLQPNEIHSGDIGDNAVISSKIADGAVTDPKVFDPPSPSHPDAVRASKLSFLQAGTDAVYRTVQDKLREFVSVKDFGAVGDGVTDDTAAIQAAINSGAKRIIAPAGGTYRITNTLTIDANYVELDFNHSALHLDDATGLRSHILLGNGTVQRHGIRIRNVTFTRAQVATAGYAINSNLIGVTEISGCRIYGDNKIHGGIRIYRGIIVNIFNNYIDNCVNRGIYLAGSGTGADRTVDVTIRENRVEGGVIALEAWDFVEGVFCRDNIFYNTSNSAVYVDASSNANGLMSFKFQENDFDTCGGGCTSTKSAMSK